jgi:hypothetical protein
MALEIQAYIDALASHAMSCGWLEKVNQYEPRSAPNTGLTAAIWFQNIKPFPGGSGLTATSVLMVMTVRIYTSAIKEPAELDMMDPVMVQVTDALITAYSGDFTLDGMIRNVDLLGEAGTPLEAEAGYLDIDRTKFRVVDITVPLIINNAFSQVA